MPQLKTDPVYDTMRTMVREHRGYYEDKVRDLQKDATRLKQELVTLQAQHKALLLGPVKDLIRQRRQLRNAITDVKARAKTAAASSAAREAHFQARDYEIGPGVSSPEQCLWKGKVSAFQAVETMIERAMLGV